MNRGMSTKCKQKVLGWVLVGCLSGWVVGWLTVARCWGNHSIYLIKSLKYKGMGLPFLAFRLFFLSSPREAPTSGLLPSAVAASHCFVYSLLCRDYTTFCGLRMIRNSHQEQQHQAVTKKNRTTPPTNQPTPPVSPQHPPTHSEKKWSFCRLCSLL